MHLQCKNFISLLTYIFWARLSVLKLNPMNQLLLQNMDYSIIWDRNNTGSQIQTFYRNDHSC